MNYIKIRFGTDFDHLETNFGKSFEAMFQAMSPMFSLAEHTWKPQMDIYETPENIFIIAEIAGAKKEDLEVEISTKAIRVYGKRWCETPSMENATYRLAEIQYGKFERVLFLPAPIDTENVSASYLDGFLKIQLAKLPCEKTCKINIS